MNSVDPKDFTARVPRIATVSADDFQSANYGEAWDAELYWGMFLWELGLLEREPKRQFIPHDQRDPYQGERNDFQDHHFGLGDEDWQRMQTIRSVQVVPVPEAAYSQRGTSVLAKGVFKPESFQRILDDLLETPGHHRTVVRLADVAEAVVETLLEMEIDPKALALRTAPLKDGHLMDIVQTAYNTVLALPWEGEHEHTFYPACDKIVRQMIADLERETGRKALDGTDGLLRASMSKPWNYEPGHKMSRKYAREIVACFRNCSKPVKTK